MIAGDDRVVVIGAGPVGLVLSLALAQAGMPVTLVEELGTDTILDQVPRAGTNHPATLEMYERIGLLDKLLPRGIVAPVFHYHDRREGLVAAFDHVALKDDTRFPYVLQCERIKVVEEALKLAAAEPLIELRLATAFTGFTQDADGVVAFVADRSGRADRIAGRYLVSGEGARSIVRKELGIAFEGFTYPDRTLNIEVAHDFRRHGYADRNYISDPEEYSNLFHWLGPPERWRVHFPTSPEDDLDAITRPAALQAAPAAVSRHRTRVRHRRHQSLCRAPTRRREIPRRAGDPRRRRGACEQPDWRHGDE